jgi:hypothetical protein
MSWQYVNPDIERVINDAAIREAIARLEGRTQHLNRSSARQQCPTLNEDRHRHSPEWYEITSRPLGRSNLRDLDRNRGATHATRRWRDENQRAGPYSTIGQVSWASDYDQRVPHRYEEEYEQDNEYEYHNRSDTLY